LALLQSAAFCCIGLHDHLKTELNPNIGWAEVKEDFGC
jgi:hypothetical protein